MSIAEKTTILPTTVETTQHITTEEIMTTTTNIIYTSTNESQNKTAQINITTSSFSNSSVVTDITTRSLFETSTELTVTEQMTTTEDPHKKTFSQWLQTCCHSSDTMYYNGIETEQVDFNVTSEMNAQHYGEVFINSILSIGEWILFVG
jgi:hypothetical protein